MNIPSRIALGGLALLAAVPPASAVIETWDGNAPNGGTGDSNISTGLNWADNTAPVSSLTDTDLVFAGSVKLSPVVNVALSTRSMTFDNTAGAFSLVGGTISVGEGGIVNNDTQNMSFLNPISFSGASKPDINAAAGGLTFASAVVLPADELLVTGGFPTTFVSIAGTSALLKEGAGTMTWSPGSAMGFDVSVTAGTLTLPTDGTADVCTPAAFLGVSGTGTLNVNENLVLDGAQLARTTGSTLNVAAGKTLTLKNGADANITGAFASPGGFEVFGAGSTFSTTGDFTLHGGGALAVRDGGSVTSGTGVIQLGDSSGTGTAVVNGAGSGFSGGILLLGRNTGAGTLTLSDNGTGSFGSLRITSDDTDNGNGTLNIQTGSAVTGTELRIASMVAENTGTVNVTGTGSSLTISGAGTGTIGSIDESHAFLNVNSGGTFTSGTGITAVRSTGLIDIGAAGTYHSKGNLTLDEGRLTRAATGVFNLDPGRTLTIQGGGDAVFTGVYSLTSAAGISLTGAGSSLTVSSTLSLSGGSSVTAAAGADIAVTVAAFNVGNAPGGASLTVDGNGSTLDAFFLTVGSAAAGNNGQAIFRNGGTGASGPVSVATHGASGSISIESASTLTGTTLTIGATAPGGTGLVTVTGAGSGLTLSGTATIGAASAGTGTLNVQTGGTFTSGTSQTVTVNTTGTIALNGGTYLSNGDLLLDGGRLTRDAAGTFTLANGKTLTVQNGGDAVFTGSYNAPPDAVYLITGAGSSLSTTGPMVLDDLSETTVSAGASLSAGTSSLTVGAGGIFDSPGTLTVDGGGSTLTAGSASLIGTGHLILSNAATATVNTLTLEDGGQGDIESGAGLNVTTLQMSQIPGGAIPLSPTTLDITGGGRLTVAGSSVIAGSGPQATVTVSNGGILTFASGNVAVAGLGHIIVQAGGTLTGPADFSADGRLTLGGFYLPGAASGAEQTTSVIIRPATTFASTGTTTLEIGGLTPGTQHDQLVFTSPANPQVTWAGTLTVSLINGFVPQAGQSFFLLNFNAARDAGTFATLNLPSLPAGLAWQSDTLYTDGTLRVISTTGLTFAQWAATVLNDPAATPGGDHDRDGLPNAVEFALALTTPVVTLHPYPDGTRLRIQFQRPLDRTGLTLKVQASSDLTSWTDLAVSVNSAPFTGPGFVSENRTHPPGEPGAVEVRDIQTTSASSRRFVRFVVILTP